MARDWTKALPGSFGGVPFKVLEDGPEVGRRVAVHEISASENVLTEDMGRKARTISVQAYVAGDLADLAGRALEAACASPGAKILTLPFDSFQTARCLSCKRQRHKDRNGYFAYSLDFVEAGGAGILFSSPLASLKVSFAAGVAAASVGFL